MAKKLKIRTGVMVKLLEDHPAYLHSSIPGSITVPAGTEVMVLESFRDYGFGALNETRLDVCQGDETFRIITRAPSRTLKIIPITQGSEIVDPWLSASGDRYYKTTINISASRSDVGDYTIPAGSIIEVYIVRRTSAGVTLHFTIAHPTSLSFHQQYPRPITRDSWQDMLVPVRRK